MRFIEDDSGGHFKGTRGSGADDFGIGSDSSVRENETDETQFHRNGVEDGYVGDFLEFSELKALDIVEGAIMYSDRVDENVINRDIPRRQDAAQFMKSKAHGEKG